MRIPLVLLVVYGLGLAQQPLPRHAGNPQERELKVDFTATAEPFPQDAKRAFAVGVFKEYIKQYGAYLDLATLGKTTQREVRYQLLLVPRAQLSDPIFIQVGFRSGIELVEVEKVEVRPGMNIPSQAAASVKRTLQRISLPQVAATRYPQ